MDVVAVGDQPAGEPVVHERGPGHTGVPVVQRALRVVEVGDQGGPDVGRGVHLLLRGVAVPHRDADPRRDEAGDGVQGPRTLGRQRDVQQDAARAGVQESVHGVGGRVDEQVLAVGATAARGQERPLEVDPEGPGGPGPGGETRLQDGEPPQGVSQLRQRRGDDRRDEARHPGAGQGAGHLRPLLVVGVGEVHAEAAVDLGVDEPGRQDAVGQRDLGGSGRPPGPDPGDAVTLHLDPARSQVVGSGEHAGRADQEGHRTLLLGDGLATSVPSGC